MKKTFDEFKAFIMRGNIVDMAIGVVMGTAFGKIVTAIVQNIFMPLVGVILGGVNFSELSITFRNSTIAYGAFIQSVIDFIIIAVCMFMLIKFMALFSRKKKQEEEAKEPEPPAKSDEAVLLEEIRDLLKKD